jgi:hypothetical protein
MKDGQTRKKSEARMLQRAKGTKAMCFLGDGGISTFLKPKTYLFIYFGTNENENPLQKGKEHRVKTPQD